MLSDTLFRVVNIAGGLGLDDELWRQQVLGPRPAGVRTGEIRRRIEAALMRDDPVAAEPAAPPAGQAVCRP